ncbi:PaaI family thioesterase [Desulforhopalus singaporensis]|uniref:Medium/long-chain acyl-CoA thioesterase YigI n=1 Tax=Desulforhopalus singaporensis TaxID=91360 RepID=A0A1H0TT23_9BACT|nr:PaaI family thioesterase [Desulforhopalus singaporensis]SDP57109.1 uncharacterized domain 1-containing protein [Desulforhopalus singaporensis]
MTQDEYQEVSRSSYMKHNGGMQFRKISDTQFQFKTTIQEIHLNTVGITHGGYIMSLLDSGMGTSAYRSLDGEKRIATISLDVKFMAASTSGDTLHGTATILRKTRSLIFVQGLIHSGDTCIASAEGIWKIL